MYRGALHISLSYSIKKGYLSQTANLFVNLKSNTTVSYTHLTLPTIYSV